ncbi:hypothetical protein, partial [Saccharothrix sp. ST-888]|uniref:hypothetical protein n=1 Tax=Saccharothrix sp. ST-888 TaxID=1427391 RepID=UPI001E2EF770
AYKRSYLDGPLYAPVTGYSSQAYGSTQLESLYSGLLGGIDPRLAGPADALIRSTPPGRCTVRARSPPSSRPDTTTGTATATARAATGTAPGTAAPTAAPSRTTCAFVPLRLNAVTL